MNSLTPLRISHQFIGYEVMNPKTIAICIINQNSTVSVFKSVSNPHRSRLSARFVPPFVLVMPVMRHARHDELGVFLLGHSGELLDKSHSRP
jgi:hypothetical protein